MAEAVRAGRAGTVGLDPERTDSRHSVARSELSMICSRSRRRLGRCSRRRGEADGGPGTRVASRIHQHELRVVRKAVAMRFEQ